jgi:hypothetical protein
MPADPIELLDRQHERLEAAQGPEFVRELARFYAFVTSTGPAEVVDALVALRADATEIRKTFADHDEQLIPQLVELRAELASIAPDADDSSLPRPSTPGRPPIEWAFTLANFDQIAAGGPNRFTMTEDEDQSRSAMLVRILQEKLQNLRWVTTSPNGLRATSEHDLRPELADLTRRLGNIVEIHRHAAQNYIQALNQHAGFQVRYLDLAVAEMNPPPRHIANDEDQHVWMNHTFLRVGANLHLLEKAAAGRRLDPDEAERLDYHVEKFKPAATRVYEDVRLKVANASTGAPRPDPTSETGQAMESDPQQVAPSAHGWQMLSCMWEAFSAAGEWPTFQFVSAQTWRDDVPEPRDVYIELAHGGLVEPKLPPERAFELRSDTRARISLQGLMFMANAQPDLGRFVSCVRYLGGRAAHFHPATSTTIEHLTVSSDELRLALPLNPTEEEIQRQAVFIRDYAHQLWTGLSGPDGTGRWSITLNVEYARQFRNIQTAIEFREVQSTIRERDSQAIKPVQPIPAVVAATKTDKPDGPPLSSEPREREPLRVLIGAQVLEENIEDLRRRVVRAVTSGRFWSDLLVWNTFEDHKADLQRYEAYKPVADAYRVLRQLNQEVPASRLGMAIPDNEIEHLPDELQVVAHGSEALSALIATLRNSVAQPLPTAPGGPPETTLADPPEATSMRHHETASSRPAGEDPDATLAASPTRSPSGAATRGRRRASWWNRHRTNVEVIAGVIAAVAAVVAVIIALGAGTSTPAAPATRAGLSGQVYGALVPGPYGAPVVETHGHAITYIDLYNNTGAPVYKAVVSLVFIQGGAWQTGRELDQNARGAAHEFQRDVQVIPTGRSRISVSGDWGSLTARPGVEIAYEDESGRSWLRTAYGQLYRLKSSPPAYYGLSTPLDWIEPQPLR